MPTLCSDSLVRRRAAILVADVAGYSRLMEQNEYGTHMRLRLLRVEVIEPSIRRHAGHVVRLAGDGMLVLFTSAAAALLCAMDMQRQISERNRSITDSDRIEFRIGINAADILIDGQEIAGTGVNLAARLESLAEPGGICVSLTLKEQSCDLIVSRISMRRLKNIGRPVRVFHVVGGRLSAHARIRTSFARMMRAPSFAGIL